MTGKKLRMFAGPNGSGKSTLIAQIGSQYNLGYTINADLVKQLLDTQTFFDCRQFYPHTLSQADWDTFLHNHKRDERNFESLKNKLTIKNNVFVCKKEINSYEASFVATFFRTKLLRTKHTFSFETVMSHDSKVQFLKEAKSAGFKTYLYFICTQDPEINKQRVLNRVQKGGHNVDPKKIENRYFRSLGLLFEAFQAVDRAFVLDSTNQNRTVILEKQSNNIIFHEQKYPEWIAIYLLDKL
ncbi:zeta toxin family protein [Membranihabitans maritimus]|uniref:zeta toxin family protein n=1 Tax=Membranihabitans maritimus TaxID=2904244 RepID=UPI001F00A06C|nr:zeta toxin family protein [Membranihabitans maritimus]